MATGPRRSTAWIAILLAVGVATLAALVLWTGAGELAAALAVGGWSLGWLVPYALGPALCAALSWHWLFAPGTAPPFALLLRATWIGLAVNWLLPVAQVGGEVVRARLLVLHRVAAAPAIASVTVDQILQLATQFAFAVIGLLALAVLAPGNAGAPLALVAVVAALGAATYGFYRASRGGSFDWLARRTTAVVRRGGLADAAAGSAAGAPRVDDAIRTAYGRRRRLIVAALWRMAFRLALAGELWLALLILGHPVTFAEAVVLESLGQAARAAAFVIPAGLGVQEGAFMALAAALGLPAETGLALALARRARELLVGVPALAAWQLEELTLRRR